MPALEITPKRYPGIDDYCAVESDGFSIFEGERARCERFVEYVQSFPKDEKPDAEEVKRRYSNIGRIRLGKPIA